MKLGIVVVYQYGDENAPLLSLHLEKIRTYTTVPYRIFGSANTLKPHLRRELERHQDVTICLCPDAPDEEDEHPHYLDQLVGLAAETDVTHIATLHLDSFPIAPGWAEILAAKLSETCVFATIEKMHTACLLFHRDFYQRYRPAFRPSTARRKERAFKAFMRTGLSRGHSGVEYAYTAYHNGLSWYSMRDTTAGKVTQHGRIYDDLMFHLGGAVELGERTFMTSDVFWKQAYQWIARVTVAVGRHTLPMWLRERIKHRVPKTALDVVMSPRLTPMQGELLRSRRRLLAHPDSYIASLRKASA